MKTCSGSPNIVLGPLSSKQELQPKFKMTQTFVTVLCDLGCLFDAFLPSPVTRVLCHFVFFTNADGLFSLFWGLTRTDSQMICWHLFDAFGLVRTPFGLSPNRLTDATLRLVGLVRTLSDSVRTISPMLVCYFRPPPFLDLYNIIGLSENLRRPGVPEHCTGPQSSNRNFNQN